MKITFVTQNPTGQYEFIKYRLPIKQEPYFDRELIWKSCILAHAVQGIDLRGHTMIEPMTCVSLQPCTFQQWEATAYRVALPMESYTQQREALDQAIEEAFSPDANDVVEGVAEEAVSAAALN